MKKSLNVIIILLAIYNLSSIYLFYRETKFGISLCLYNGKLLIILNFILIGFIFLTSLFGFIKSIFNYKIMYYFIIAIIFFIFTFAAHIYIFFFLNPNMSWCLAVRSFPCCRVFPPDTLENQNKLIIPVLSEVSTRHSWKSTQISNFKFISYL